MGRDILCVIYHCFRQRQDFILGVGDSEGKHMHCAFTENSCRSTRA